MKDTLKHQGLRRQMVLFLKKKGIQNPVILAALEQIPRHLFLDSSFENHAYEDKAFPIGAEQTISHPFTVAFQSELLDPHPNQKVLEIGTGSGYQTAVLCALGCQVYTIERQHELFKNTKKKLNTLGYRPKTLSFGDGYNGYALFAPFDRILVTAGAPFIPKALLKQLKIGGKLVIPLGVKSQIMTVLVRKNEKEFEKKEFGNFQFVPLLAHKS